MALEFDYVVVGGGTAGAVVARRLAQDRNLRVALIEAGPSDEGNDMILTQDRSTFQEDLNLNATRSYRSATRKKLVAKNLRKHRIRRYSQ